MHSALNWTIIWELWGSELVTPAPKQGKCKQGEVQEKPKTFVSPPHPVPIKLRREAQAMSLRP